jgi:putative two-component system response regulator
VRVLILDDSSSSVMLLVQLVSKIEGCTALPFTDVAEALSEAEGSAIDLALVDYMMPRFNGIDVVKILRAMPGGADLPIVMLTGRDAIRHAALDAGVTDFLTKPLDTVEVKLRIRNMLKLRESQNKLRDKASWLAEEVRKATSALALREEEIIFRLSRAAEYRDSDTGHHIERMAKYSLLIAEALGLDEEACRSLYLSCPMHDVGKIAIRDAVLLKPGQYSAEERTVMEEHVNHGYEILANSNSALIQTAASIALSHHERWDGTGYPRGLCGTEIPLFARIATVADVFDALTSERPYKRAWSIEEARVYLKETSGKQFDPDCVAAFMRRWNDVLIIHGGHKALRARWSDTEPKCA